MTSSNDQRRRRSLLYALTGAGLLGGTGIAGLIRTAQAAGASIAKQGIRGLSGDIAINGTARRISCRPLLLPSVS